MSNRNRARAIAKSRSSDELRLAKSRQSLFDQRHKIEHFHRLIDNLLHPGSRGFVGRLGRGEGRDQQPFDSVTKQTHSTE